MADVLAPKVDGIEILSDLLADEPLDFFVSFSSTAGQIPAFMRGMSDYGLANAYLDTFSDYQADHGKPHFRSMAWIGWSDTGSHTRETGTRAMVEQNARRYGLLFNTTPEGLRLFDDALTSTRARGGSMLPGLLDRSVFDRMAATLLFARPSTGQPDTEESSPPPSPTIRDKQAGGPSAFDRAIATLRAGGAIDDVLMEVDIDALEDWQVRELSAWVFDTSARPIASSPMAPPPITPPPIAPPSSVIPPSPAISPSRQQVQGEQSREHDVRALIAGELAKILKIDRSAIHNDESFQDYGLDSITGTQLATRVEQALGIEVSPAWLVEFPTVDALAERILLETQRTARAAG